MRLFVAVEVPPAAKEAVHRAIAAARGELPPARWVDPDSLHLTLAFLGETEPRQLPALEAALAAACAAFVGIDLRIAGAGTFPPRQPARVVWLGLKEEADSGAAGGLAGLGRSVQEHLRQAVGWRPEARPFAPHLTVARCRPPWPPRAVERFTSLLGGFDGEPFRVTRIVLMESELRPSGARHRVAAAFPLGGGS